MLKVEKEVKLTGTKFHEAKVYPFRNKGIFVSLESNLYSENEESNSMTKKYAYDTYAFSSINENLRKIKDLKIMDLTTEKIG